MLFIAEHLKFLLLIRHEILTKYLRLAYIFYRVSKAYSVLPFIEYLMPTSAFHSIKIKHMRTKSELINCFNGNSILHIDQTFGTYLNATEDNYVFN